VEYSIQLCVAAEATIPAKDKKDVVGDNCCKVVKLILVFFTTLNQYTYTLVTCFMNTSVTYFLLL